MRTEIQWGLETNMSQYSVTDKFFKPALNKLKGKKIIEKTSGAVKQTSKDRTSNPKRTNTKSVFTPLPFCLAAHTFDSLPAAELIQN